MQKRENNLNFIAENQIKMKLLSILILCMLISIVAFSQTNIETANSCYSKRDYQCAIDNYLIALNKRTYKEGQQYLLEYRIGNGYSYLKQYDKAIEYLQKSIANKSDDLYSYWALADTYYNMYKYEEAAINYKKALDYVIAAEDKETINW